jgi:uncharacterized repeat protein (TIGR01451 family)
MRKVLLLLLPVCLFLGTKLAAQVTLSLSQTATPTTVQSGETFQYVFSYAISSTTGSGNIVTITDTLPAGVTYVSAVFNASHITSVVQSALTNGQTKLVVNFKNPIASGSSGQVSLACKYASGTTPNNTTTTNYGYITAANANTSSRNKRSTTGGTVTATATMPFFVDKETYAYNAETQRVTWRIKVHSTKSCNNGVGVLNVNTVQLRDSLPTGAVLSSVSSNVNSQNWSYSVDSSNRVLITLPNLDAATWCQGGWFFYVSAIYPESIFVGGSTVINRAILRGTPVGASAFEVSDTAAQTLLATLVGSNCSGGLNLDLKGVGNTQNFVTANYQNSGNVNLLNYTVTVNLPTATDAKYVKNGEGGVEAADFKLEYRTNQDATWQLIGQYASSSTSNVALPTPSNGYITEIRKVYDTLAPSAFARLKVQFTLLAQTRAGATVVGIERPQAQSPCLNGYSCLTFNSTLSYTFRSVNYSDGCSITKMPYRAGPAVAYNRTTVTSSGPYVPGSTVKFFLEFMNAGELDFENVTFNSTLNDIFEFVSWNPKSQNGSAWNPSPTFTRTGQNMTWVFNTANAANIWQRNGEGYGVEVVARVKSFTAPNNYAHTYTATATNYAVPWTGSGATITIQAVVALDAVKWSRGSLNVGYVKYPDVASASTTRAGRADYRLTIKNQSNITMNNFEIIEILPHIGDLGVATATARSSQWRPNLVSTIDVPTGVTVYYSLAKNPCRTSVNPDGPSGCTTANWSTTPPVDITLVQSLRFVFSGLPLLPMDSLVLSWSMRAPADAPTAGEVAWSSFAYTGSRADNNETLLPAEPTKVGIKLLQPPANSSSIGDFVWVDKNGNGLQDSNEPGLNGVRVELLNADGTPAYDMTGQAIPFTMTANNSAGYAGYFLFQMVPIGSYYLQFSGVPSGLSIAQRVTGNAGTDNSDVNSNSRTDVFDVAANQAITHLDLGLQCTPPSVSAVLTPPTCGGAAYNNNGKITLTGFGTNDRAAWTIGSTFSDNGKKTYTLADAIPTNGIIVSTLPNPSVATDYTVRVFTPNGCYQDVTLTLQPRPMMTLTSQPVGITECIGGNFTMSVTTSGPATYRWQSSLNGTNSWANLTGTGATSSTLVVPSATAGVQYYRAVATSTGVSECGILTATGAAADIRPDPSVSVTGTASAVCVGGGGVVLSSSFGGGLPTSTCTLQWQNSTNGTTWTPIVDATNATFTTPNLTITTHYRIIRICTGNGCDQVISAPYVVNVANDPAITAQPVGLTQCQGGLSLLNVGATGGTPALTYQWQSSLTNANWANVAGATQATYVPWSGRIGTINYRVIVKAAGLGCDSTISTLAAVTVEPRVLIATHPEDIMEYVGDVQGLGIVTNGGVGTISYQWQSSANRQVWTDITNATDSTWIPTSAVAGVTYYRVVVSASGSGCGNLTSRPAKVTVLAGEPTTNGNAAYDLRFKITHLDCIKRRAYVAVQVKANSSNTRFFMGDAQLRFTHDVTKSRLVKSVGHTNFSSWTPSQDPNYLGQTFTKTPLSNNQELITIGINYAAKNERAKLVDTAWLTVNMVQVDIIDQMIPINFTWNTTTPTVINEVIIARIPTFSYTQKAATHVSSSNISTTPMERLSRLEACPENITISTFGYSAVATWTPPTVSDNCGTTYVYSNYNPGVVLGLGVNNILYTSLQSNSASRYVDTCRFQVTVLRAITPCDTDRIAPVLTNCPRDTSINVSTSYSSRVSWTPPTVSDNCTPNPALRCNFPSGGNFPLGTSQVIYTAIDNRNNTAVCAFNITVSRVNLCDNETTPPVLSGCPTNITVSAGSDYAKTATWTAPTATDNCSTPRILSNFNSGATFGLGTTPVVYTAIDGRGNRSTCSFTVTVTRQALTTDVEVSASLDKSSVLVGQDIRLTVTVVNKGGIPANNVTFSVPFANNGLAFRNQTISKGFYNITTNQWQIGTLNANETVVLSINSRVLADNTPTSRFIQLLSQNPLDLDSKPNNNTTSLPVEDDEAKVSFTIGSGGNANFVINNGIAAAILQEDTYKFDKLAITEAYPNPIADVLSVEVVTNFEGETTWDFTNITGVSVRNEKRMLKKHVNQLVFDLTDLPSGIYMIVPKTPNRYISPFKIIKL